MAARLLLRVTVIAWMAIAGHALSAQQPSRGGTPRDMDVLKTRGGLASLPSPVCSRMGQDGKFFKKPLPGGVQMKELFAVTPSWGRLEGKPGDWLVQYDEAGTDFGIVDQKEFEQTYSRLTVTPDLRAKLDAMRARVPKH